MKSPVQKNPNGFTLIELLIFMGLFSVVLVVLSSLFAATVQQQLETQAISATESDSTYVISRLQYDFDRAIDIVTPASPGETSNTLTLDIGGQEYSYAVVDDIFTLTTPTDTYALTGPRSAVTAISFRQLGNIDGNPTIEVQMDITSVAENATGTETAPIRTTYSIR